MKYKDSLKRSVATFLFGALSTPVSAAVFDIAAWKFAIAAGVTALINLAYRSSEAYLNSIEDI